MKTLLPIFLLVTAGFAAEFTHPGLLHSSNDVARMRAAVVDRQEPIYSGFLRLASNELSRAEYKMRGPFREWGRDPKRPGHKRETEQDVNAAYQNALMWAATGDRAHAAEAIRILNAWSTTLTNIYAGDVLAAGLQGFKFANAAELIRHTGAGWAEADAERFERWLMAVWYPVIKDYAHYANANWEGAALRTIAAIAVYCDDRELFESAMRYAVNGAGNGSITHTIVYPTGQGQESSRTQSYAQLGLGLLSQVAEVAWHQGVDLYGWADNRILAGFEFTAKYNLGEDVPFRLYLDRTGKYGAGGYANNYTKMSTALRGRFQPIYEMALNHYAGRRGIAAPYAQRVVERIRPEGFDVDQPGFGTLSFHRASVKPSAPEFPPGRPAGLVARSTAGGVNLIWARAVEPLSASDAHGYTVKRGTSAQGPFAVVGENVPTNAFLDAQVTRGAVYYYVISAFNKVGASSDSVALAAGAGLPAPWRAQDIGDVQVPGYTEFDGQTFSLEGCGADIAGSADSFHFTFRPIAGDGAITARLREPVSSQKAVIGVMMRETLESNSRHVAVLIRRRTDAGLVVRAAKGGKTAVAQSDILRDARWLRLARAGNRFTGYVSAEGRTWTEIGSVESPMIHNVFAGLPACSRLKGVTTTATYDHVTVNE